jgi:hypothetical protein
MSSQFNLHNLDVSDSVKAKLIQNLRGTVEGSDNVVVTPLGKNNDPEALLSGWDKVFQDNIGRMNSALLEIEESNRGKYGPRSIQKPWSERKESLEAYFHDQGARPVSSNVQLGNKLRPLSLDKAVQLLKNSTNSGLPWYTRKSEIKDELVSNFDYYLGRQDPCVLFTRTQEQGKTRNVWGYPAADTLNEMRYYAPLLDYQKKLSWRAALNSPDTVDRGITNLINNAMISGKKLISIDFSAYDASVGKELQQAAFNYVASLFQTSCSEDLEYIAQRFNTIGIVTPDGIWEKPHGVPSGSTFTNEVDSLAQFSVISNLGTVDESTMQIQGDDGAYAVWADSIEETFKGFEQHGLKVNEEKSVIADDYVVYLQKLYHNDYRQDDGLIGGIYSTYRALSRLVYQERWSNFTDEDISGEDYYSLRAISILENCKYHPLFEELVKYVVEIDDRNLRFTENGLRSYIRMQQKDGTVGNITNQYGDKGNIKSFASYKLISKIVGA